MTEMLYTPKSEVDARIQLFQTTLDQMGIDGALIIHHTNLFYLSGTSQSAHLFIPRSGQPILMVRKSFVRARQESPLAEIVDVKSIKAIPELLAEKGYSLDAIGLELDVIPYNTWQLYKKSSRIPISRISPRRSSVSAPSNHPLRSICCSGPVACSTRFLPRCPPWCVKA